MSVIDRALDRLAPVAPWVHFQGSLSEDPLDLSVPEAMIAAMVTAISADDVQSAEESVRLTSVLSTSRLFRHAAGPHDADIVARVVTLLREHGRRPVLEACARTIPPELRTTALANAIDLVFADGRVGEREKAFVDELARILGIDDAVAEKIAEVLAIKNRT
jgi:hypothetical protein